MADYMLDVEPILRAAEHRLTGAYSRCRVNLPASAMLQDAFYSAKLHTLNVSNGRKFGASLTE
jgi:hypothetical protein